MNKYILLVVLIIILVVIYYFTHINTNNYISKELFESEQEFNPNNETNQDSSQYTLFIIFSVIVLCLMCSIIYYFNTNIPISELIQKKQLEQTSLTNTSDSSKPYIIIVQPSIIPVNQTQPFSQYYPSNMTNPYQIQ